MRIKTKQGFGVNVHGTGRSQNSLREITGKVRTMPEKSGSQDSWTEGRQSLNNSNYLTRLVKSRRQILEKRSWLGPGVCRVAELSGFLQRIFLSSSDFGQSYESNSFQA